MTLINTLKETPTNELLRAYFSNKEYLYFNISVFNVGAAIWIKCTDIYKEINYNTWNGYDFIHENDQLMNDFIKNVLIERVVRHPESNNMRVYPTQLKRINKIIKNHK